jgi:hypothetical protein
MPVADGRRAVFSPRFIARLGALPASGVEALSTPEIRTALQVFLEARDCLRTATQETSEALFAAVGAETDGIRRRSLVRIRRDLYNGRRPRPADLRAIESASAVSLLAGAMAAFDDSDRAWRALESALECGVPEVRRSLKSVLSGSAFSSGVLLSSPSLFNNFLRYQRADASDLSAKDLQVERGILRYLTRTMMKATPFGSFCGVVEGMIDAACEPENVVPSGTPIGVGSLKTMRSVVRLNKVLYASLWDHLKRRPAVRDQLAVVLNPTTQTTEKQLSFVALVGKGELLQRMDLTDELKLILHEVHSNEGCRHGKLVSVLQANEEIDATLEEITAYLDALIRIGLLRFVSPVRAQDTEWPVTLADYLKEIDDPHAIVAAKFLRDAQTIARDYASADTPTRAQLGRRLRESLNESCKDLEMFRPSDNTLLLYEDCGADLTVHISQTPAVGRMLASVVDFIACSQVLAMSRTEMAGMRHFFDGQYERTRATVPLLTFFDDFHRLHLTEHLSKGERIAAGDTDESLRGYDMLNPFGLDEVRRVRAEATRWTSVIQAAWQSAPDAEEININPSDFSSTGTTDRRNDHEPRSVSIFGQIVPATTSSGRPRVVLINGQTFLGFGKYFSRFLHLVPPAFTDAVAGDNATSDDAWIAEIANDGDFNANLHPPLLPKWITYPTGDADGVVDGISCVDLDVSREETDPLSLKLIHRPTGARVYPIDLGFLNPKRRPALYRLLFSFSPNGNTWIPLPGVAKPNAKQGSSRLEAIVYRPRVVYDECVVLARRRWTIPFELYPRRKAGEGDTEFFIRVNEWRSANSIPARVFVRIMPAPRVPIKKTPEKIDALAAAEPQVAEPQVDEPQVDEPMVDEPMAEADMQADPAVEGESVQAVEPAGAVKSPTAQDATERRPRNGASRDFTKPQFIDFESPLLADLFGRLPATLNDFVAHIDEEYPASEARPMIDGEPHAVEYIFQMNWAAST